jgi:biotin carboxyl carrier protein
LTAPIPGKVVAVKVGVGDGVEPGQALIVLEAMKMENELAADQVGKVAAIHVAAGDTVEGGELLVELE